MNQGVSEYQRARVIELRRNHSFREVADMTGLPLGTVKTITSRSGAFRDNEAHRTLFCLPPMQVNAGASLALQSLPEQKAVTGDKELDALLWLREVIGTGHPAHIQVAMEAAKKIRTPFKQLEDRCRVWMTAKQPHSLYAALSVFGLDDLDGLAKRSMDKLRLQTEARARFGDRIFSLTDAELFCESALDGLLPDETGGFNNAEVASRFKARPDLMPYTLSDCLRELAYWNQLYWLRHAVSGDHAHAIQEASARDWFVFELLAEIRPRNKDEAKDVLRYLVGGDRGDMRRDFERIVENLIG